MHPEAYLSFALRFRLWLCGTACPAYLSGNGLSSWRHYPPSSNDPLTMASTYHHRPADHEEQAATPCVLASGLADVAG
ncbi:uncharacterized protein B0I36DRAFT_325441 [Microdochium trichocladiopsis]|uniref:Secreted protein n=1 Tax=Microdochium trichocladiopsis TaxID=1682393 RepID=A0A9P8Y4N3_9PEZI|nr:uncharacterized protein B0I36DRAFT_325441 [Microdochium trichocladiopsis]KAH7029299.1 hypothetical protein B0I36DRAFT_325441 [Microdochium trichocladiopsis]